MTGPVSRFVRGNGLKHHVLAWDGGYPAGSNPSTNVVVLLHGYLDLARSFVEIGDAIHAAGFRVYALDFRGHGESDWVPEGGYYHFPDYVADLTSVLATLAPESEVPALSLVAHSMGGSVATMFAGVFPGRIRSLALLEGIGPMPMGPEAAPERVGKWLERALSPRARERKRFANVDEATERLRVMHGGSVPDEVLARHAREQTIAHPSGYGLTWRFDPLHQTTSPTRFDAEAFAAFAQKITAPALLLDGGAAGFQWDGIEDRKKLYARARSVSLEGAGHMMHWTQPREVLRELVPFLRDESA